MPDSTGTATSEVKALAMQAMERRDFVQARALCEQWAQQHPKDPQPWIHLALACRGLKDDQAEEGAIAQALRADSHDLMALLMRGHLFERLGKRHEAARAYQAARLVAPPMEQLVAHLRPGVARAMEFSDRYHQDYARAVDEVLAREAQSLSGNELDRFRLSIDILMGRKPRYESRPLGYFVPQLAPVEFFDRDAFPWLEAVEACTADVREEFLQVLAQDTGFVPYVRQSEDQPLNQWAELNHSLKWSAFHLLKEGVPVPGNAQRCPKTMAMLSQVPQPVQSGRTPVALFSALKPHTRIPPHTGVSNARLLTHLPLIVPPHCQFRVGNTVREWVPGQAWVFDDTIEHEARNDSDQLRVILIFDVWHPALSEAEKRMISALARAQDAFMGASPDNYSN
ncbi:MAG: aspartyl beta-hydroxylase [Betaproteobacteria bacterium]|nr:aspartyl beta-hydroxylase [Betaproteobacteria bacterium]